MAEKIGHEKKKVDDDDLCVHGHDPHLSVLDGRALWVSYDNWAMENTVETRKGEINNTGATRISTQEHQRNRQTADGGTSIWKGKHDHRQ